VGAFVANISVGDAVFDDLLVDDFEPLLLLLLPDKTSPVGAAEGDVKPPPGGTSCSSRSIVQRT